LSALLALNCSAGSAFSTQTAPAGSGKNKLLLFAKSHANWAIVKSGGSGKLVYREASGNFTLTAIGLHPRTSYAFVRYADAPPDAEILARGSSDAHGKL
jgi:hypothetical protein